MILKEDNYLYVDLQPLFAKAAQNETAAKTGEAPAGDTPSADAAGLPTDQEAVGTHKAWGDMLTNRLAENRKLGANKKPEEAVIQDFFKEYYNNVWGTAVGEQLYKVGDLLRADLQKLGWDKNRNPILAFIAQKYVSENLLATKLLNVNTYKALHNALAKHYVAHSEFRGTRNYNLIYCKSLYNKMPADILEYLKKQKNILATDATKYPIETQKRNRMVFLKLKNNAGQTAQERADFQYKFGQDLKTLPHMGLSDAKLLDLEAAELVMNKYNIKSPSEDDAKGKKTGAGAGVVAKLVDELNQRLAHQQALLMNIAFGASKESAAAIKAFLAQDKFSSVTPDKAIEAWQQISKSVGSFSFDDAAIEALIKGFNGESADDT